MTSTDKNNDKKNASFKKTERKIPFKERPKKSVNILLLFLLCIIATIIFFLSPGMSYVVKLLPESWLKDRLSPIYQEKIIIDTEIDFKEPVNLALNTPLKILGQDSGLCFEFNTTIRTNDNEKGPIATIRLRNAAKYQPIAKVTITGNDGKTYVLEDTILEEKTNKNSTFICQRFGRKYSYPPESATHIKIEPLYLYRSQRLIWQTKKTIH